MIAMQRQVAATLHRGRSKHECSLAEEQEATHKLRDCTTVLSHGNIYIGIVVVLKNKMGSTGAGTCRDS